MSRWRDEGFTVIWVVGVTVGMLGMIGLVVDGGTVLRSRAQLHSTAAAAGRAGAQIIDEDALLTSEGLPRMDRDGAEATARSYLRTRGFAGDDVDIHFSDDDTEIFVALEDRVAFQIFPGVSRDIRMVATTRTAET